MEAMTKPRAREWPLEKSLCETILEMNDEAPGSHHHTQEWDSKAVQDAIMVKEHHQDKKENNTNIEPLEGLTKETIGDKALDKQVDRQWDEHLREGWWKNAKITVIGESMWKIITEP
jgi:ribosomal protein L5